MSVSAVSSVDKRNQIFRSADSPAGNLKELALRITESVKDKIFRVIYYIRLVGRIIENYFEEQAKNNYDNNLHLARSYYDTLYDNNLLLARSYYDRLIEYVENSDAERATICAGFAKSFAEQFAKMAAAIPKDDKEFAEEVDLDVEDALALVAAAQEALDKIKEEK